MFYTACRKYKGLTTNARFVSNQFYDIFKFLSGGKMDKCMLLLVNGRMDICCSIAKYVGVILIPGPCEGSHMNRTKQSLDHPEYQQ